MFDVFFRKMYTKQWLIWNHTTAGMYMPVPSCTISYHHWLVVWTMNYFIVPFHIWDNPSQLTFIFFRGVGQPPTTYIYTYVLQYSDIYARTQGGSPMVWLVILISEPCLPCLPSCLQLNTWNPVNNQKFSMVCFPMIVKNNYIRNGRFGKPPWISVSEWGARYINYIYYHMLKPHNAN